MRSCHLAEPALLMDVAALYAAHNEQLVQQIFSQAGGKLTPSLSALALQL